ncbi:MAG: hypothetical protein HKM24_06330 [Gammaproteobacteria bacterium]|nr:hypothetical protein [Gammaproteobacteria bacterium]
MSTQKPPTTALLSERQKALYLDSLGAAYSTLRNDEQPAVVTPSLLSDKNQFKLIHGYRCVEASPGETERNTAFEQLLSRVRYQKNQGATFVWTVTDADIDRLAQQPEKLRRAFSELVDAPILHAKQHQHALQETFAECRWSSPIVASCGHFCDHIPSALSVPDGALINKNKRQKYAISVMRNRYQPSEYRYVINVAQWFGDKPLHVVIAGHGEFEDNWRGRLRQWRCQLAKRYNKNITLRDDVRRPEADLALLRGVDAVWIPEFSSNDWEMLFSAMSAGRVVFASEQTTQNCFVDHFSLPLATNLNGFAIAKAAKDYFSDEEVVQGKNNRDYILTNKWDALIEAVDALLD